MKKINFFLATRVQNHSLWFNFVANYGEVDPDRLKHN